MALFEIAFALVLDHEGGYVHDKNDPGGETIYGISRTHHPEVWAKGTPTEQQAKAIYKRDYWNACRCDDLPPAIAIMVFDSAVNQGPTQAIRFLQRAINVKDDGIIGPNTIKAAKHSNTLLTLVAIASLRIKHYTALSTWQRYGMGWSKRVFLTTITAANYT